MPRMARETLDLDAYDEGPAGPALIRHAPGFDWSHAQNDRRPSERQSRLARTLELDIIPRLIDSHRAAPAEPAMGAPVLPAPSTQDVEDFVQLVLAREAVAAEAFIDVLMQNGMSVETVYLDLLAPAAQHLNYLWSQDLCDFTQVTLGLARMQRLLHTLSPSMSVDDARVRGNARRVLLLPACGEAPTFGLSMVGELFTHAGWEVDCGGHPAHTDVRRLVGGEWFDVLGFAAGSETSLETLRDAIQDARAASRNRQLGVLVGGPIFAGHPERVKFVGADSSGLDGKQALVNAERLVGRADRSH